jgi:uracil-DNA glycosylase
MTPSTFVETLSSVRLPNVFNPWVDRCAIHDRSDAAARRRANLLAMLEAALDERAETMWIARDLGYRGGRRTGVPLTDEVHLIDAGQLLGGLELERARGRAGVVGGAAPGVWEVLREIGLPVVLWNVFPFHPHERDDPMSNRCHTRREREATWPLLQALIEMVRPKTVVAIGRDAHMALSELTVPVICVRHPSYGGQREFIDGMHSHYGVAAARRTRGQLELEVA